MELDDVDWYLLEPYIEIMYETLKDKGPFVDMALPFGVKAEIINYDGMSIRCIVAYDVIEDAFIHRADVMDEDKKHYTSYDPEFDPPKTLCKCYDRMKKDGVGPSKHLSKIIQDSRNGGK